MRRVRGFAADAAVDRGGVYQGGEADEVMMRKGWRLNPVLVERHEQRERERMARCVELRKLELMRIHNHMMRDREFNADLSKLFVVGDKKK